MQREERGSEPWYKEPWPWLLMAGPFAAIIGCVITIVLAFQNNPDRDVRLGVRKQGLVVTREEPGSLVPAAPTAPTNVKRE